MGYKPQMQRGSALLKPHVRGRRIFMITVRIYSGPRYVCEEVSTVEEARTLRDEYKSERDREVVLNPGRWSRWNCVCYDKNAVRFDDSGRITIGEIAL